MLVNNRDIVDVADKSSLSLFFEFAQSNFVRAAAREIEIAAKSATEISLSLYRLTIRLAGWLNRRRRN